MFPSKKVRSSRAQNTSNTAIIAPGSHDMRLCAKHHSSDETESSSIDFQNAKETASYMGEIVTEINLPSRPMHSSATMTIIPSLYLKDDSGEMNESPFVKEQEKSDDIKFLKMVIHRLNAELDKYQRKFRPLIPTEMESIDGLPFKGPHPTWLVCRKQLSPLLLAYDEQFKNLNGVVNEMKAHLENFRQEMDEIILENKKLQRQIKMLSFDSNNQNEMPMTQLSELKLHCALVLEENQLILKQLNAEKEKFMKATAGKAQQISALTKRLTLVTLEKDKLMFENEESKAQLSKLKHEFATKPSLPTISEKEHLQQVNRLRQHHVELNEALQEAKEKNKEEKNEFNRIAGNLRRKIKKLNFIRNRDKTRNRIIVCRLRMLKRKKEQIAELNSLVKGFLLEVLKTQAELTARERNILSVKKDHQKEMLTTLIQMLKTSVADNNFKQKGEILSSNRNIKCSTAKRRFVRLRNHSQAMNSQNDQYEKDIKVLKSILEERDNYRDTEMQNRFLSRDLRELNECSHHENRSLAKYVNTICQYGLKWSLFPEEIVTKAENGASTSLKLTNSDSCDCDVAH